MRSGVTASVRSEWAPHGCRRFTVWEGKDCSVALIIAPGCKLLFSSCISPDKEPGRCVQALCSARRMCSKGCAVPAVAQIGAAVLDL